MGRDTSRGSRLAAIALSLLVLGVSALKGHILIAPFDPAALEALRPRLEGDGYVVNKKTVRVPLDWEVDEALLVDLVGAALGG